MVGRISPCKLKMTRATNGPVFGRAAKVELMLKKTLKFF